MTASVFQPKRFSRLCVSDAMNISRDPTLMFAILLSAVPAFAAAYFWNMANAAAVSAFGVDNIMGSMLPVIFSLPAFLIGWVTGFLFLEDRDDGPLMAVDVTPVGKGGFILYRSTVTVVFATAITVLGWSLLAPQTSWRTAMVLCVFVSLEAVASAFALPAIARNKVEGLALTKVTNLVSIASLIAIVPSPLRYLAAPLPTFWVGELLGVSTTQYLPWGVIVGLGLLVHVLAAVLLYRLLLRKAG